MASTLRFGSWSIPFVCWLVWGAVLAASDRVSLTEDLQPWFDIVSGEADRFGVEGTISARIDGQPQAIELDLRRYDDEAFDLALTHRDYALAIRRRPDGIALSLPKHGVTFVGRGSLQSADSLRPAELLSRLVTSRTQARFALPLLQPGDASLIVNALQSLVDLKWIEERAVWKGQDETTLRFADNGDVDVTVGETRVQLSRAGFNDPTQWDDWPGTTIRELPRDEIESQLARGLRRTLEILAPSQQLTSPLETARNVPHGELRWIDHQRVVLLDGTPEEIGRAHGELLKSEARSCMDSVLCAFGTVQTIRTGRWFREDLDEAYRRLSPHIPERHKVETRSLAASLQMEPQRVEALNVFPELFHCSGFALFGEATVDGKLYHGRVLDYMTMIGLQDAATTFIVRPEGRIPFVNVGYAGFIGSVSGMNAEQISLGEMGGRGEGLWDGVPMATLMRRALEECDSLAEVKQLWSNSPRTCEYYYVFADGEEKSAVGVAATPESVQFIEPGAFHELLGKGMPDTLMLSAGSRLDELRRRVKESYGRFDAASAMQLMCRPVAMKSNLHNVLFVPEDLVLYVANASHNAPAAERPYARIDFRAVLNELTPTPAVSADVPIPRRFHARDTLDTGDEPNPDAAQCLAGLCWPRSEFEVELQPVVDDQGDALVRFPSARPSGDARNDLVAMEWYQAGDPQGNLVPAPAVVVVHESGRKMVVGRMIARMLRAKGVHTFLLQLPYYGERRGPTGRPSGAAMVAGMRQAIADARRARDAIAVLPNIQADHISLQGTSLGGFVAATAAGLDHGYDNVIILLAGGNLYNVLMEGQKDAAKFRTELTRTGLTDEQVQSLLREIEPLRLAHRINSDRTWLFSGKYDDVVPPQSSHALATAAKLNGSHHTELLANHYSGIVLLPFIVQQMAEIVNGSPATTDAQ
ncbi:MAG: C45 family autoproteolytic acyltransferase/hydrolase [Planctomycetaceae bacterium]